MKQVIPKQRILMTVALELQLRHSKLPAVSVERLGIDTMLAVSKNEVALTCFSHEKEAGKVGHSIESTYMFTLQKERPH